MDSEYRRLLERALEVGFEYHDGRQADTCDACRLYLEIEAALKPKPEAPSVPST